MDRDGARPARRLPSTRALVAEYGASPVTVQKALRALATHGLIESRPGVGTFVRAVRDGAADRLRVADRRARLAAGAHPGRVRGHAQRCRTT